MKWIVRAALALFALGVFTGTREWVRSGRIIYDERFLAANGIAWRPEEDRTYYHQSLSMSPRAIRFREAYDRVETGDAEGRRVVSYQAKDGS